MWIGFLLPLTLFALGVIFLVGAGIVFLDWFRKFGYATDEK